MTTASRATTGGTGEAPLDVDSIRGDFPLLRREVHGKPLVYLDSAATSQKPQCVLDAIQHFYTHSNSNIHRGVHQLSLEATEAYERSRNLVRRMINAAEAREIVFVRSATEAINLVAASYGRMTLQPGDEVLISHMEHHSNIVPWQMLAEATGAVLRVAPIDDRGVLLMDQYESMLNERTRIVSMVHVSNSLGTINPIRRITELAHRAGAIVVVDGAQAAQHMPIDVRAIGCDFYAISGHKMFGPTGVGVLYGRAELLEAMPPYQGGGEMIKSVSFDRTVYNDVPHKFEAGTPHIAGVVGLGAAVEYLGTVGMEAVAAHERRLLEHAERVMAGVPQLRLIGIAPEKVSCISFALGEIHPHDVGTVLDHQGIAVRTGHHCTQPVMDRFGLTGTVRASLCMYNTPDEIDALAAGLYEVLAVLG